MRRYANLELFDDNGEYIPNPYTDLTHCTVTEHYTWQDDIMKITQSIITKMDNARMSEICNHLELDCSELREWIDQKNKNVKTNADRIRAMSDEELAKIIGKNIDCKICRNMANTDGLCPASIINGELDCSGVWLDWLKKEVEDG